MAKKWIHALYNKYLTVEALQKAFEDYAAQEVAKALEPHKWKPISEIKKDGTLYQVYHKVLHRLNGLYITEDTANFHTAKYCQSEEYWLVDGLIYWNDITVDHYTHCRVLDIPEKE